MNRRLEETVNSDLYFTLHFSKMHVGQNILTQKLKATLEQRRRDGRLLIPPVPMTLADTVDFGSNDTLSLSGSGLLSAAFLRELERHPGFRIGSTSARAFEGTRKYLIDLEDDLAKFHGAEAGVFVNSGFDGNVAIWSSIPQPGDFIVYDELAHASIHDGMRMGRATCLPFRHNDCESLKARLEDIREHNASVASGENVVFISIESFYSMDGDAAPIHGIVAAAREALPVGNYLCAIDEAHSNGLVGPNGSGYVCHFGLEKEFPIRLNTCGKALGSTGGEHSPQNPHQIATNQQQPSSSATRPSKAHSSTTHATWSTARHPASSPQPGSARDMNWQPAPKAKRFVPT